MNDLYLRNDAEDHGCCFEEFRDGKMKPCGKPAIGRMGCTNKNWLCKIGKNIIRCKS